MSLETNSYSTYELSLLPLVPVQPYPLLTAVHVWLWCLEEQSKRQTEQKCLQGCERDFHDLGGQSKARGRLAPTVNIDGWDGTGSDDVCAHCGSDTPPFSERPPPTHTRRHTHAHPLPPLLICPCSCGWQSLERGAEGKVTPIWYSRISVVWDGGVGGHVSFCIRDITTLPMMTPCPLGIPSFHLMEMGQRLYDLVDVCIYGQVIPPLTRLRDHSQVNSKHCCQHYCDHGWSFSHSCVGMSCISFCKLFGFLLLFSRTQIKSAHYTSKESSRLLLEIMDVMCLQS